MRLTMKIPVVSLHGKINNTDIKQTKPDPH